MAQTEYDKLKSHSHCGRQNIYDKLEVLDRIGRPRYDHPATPGEAIRGIAHIYLLDSVENCDLEMKNLQSNLFKSQYFLHTIKYEKM